MPPLPKPPRPLLAALALLLAAGAVCYSAIWIYYIRHYPAAQLGIDADYEPSAGAFRVTRVYPGSAAERSGLQADDRIVAVDSRPLRGPYLEPVLRGAPGETVSLTVLGPGREQPLTLSARLDARPSAPLTAAQTLALETIWLYPVPFLLVGFGVLFARLEDRNAWLLALLFCSFIALAPFLMIEGRTHPAMRGFALFWKVVFYGVAPALLYFFFAVFPARSPIDRRVPRLKHLLLWSAVAVAVPVGLTGWLAGGSGSLLALAHRVAPLPASLGIYFFGGFALGLTSLVWNARTATAEARRKTRVIVWGTVVGFTPGLILAGVATATHRDVYELGFWLWAPAVLVLFLMPLSFAYAVLKHRVLDVPVLLRRSARYLLVKRGFTVLTVGTAVGATLLLAASFSSLLSARTPLAVPAGLVVGVGFGALLVSAGMRMERQVATRIDRAFFRSAYDARQILQDLADHVRGATDRQALAVLLERHVREALHPRALAVYLESADGRLRAERGPVPPGLETVAPSLPMLEVLARRGQPWEIPPQARLDGLEAFDPECLVPLLGRSSRLLGLMLLGERLSEEPYSGEDRRLLSSVAGQAGIALENIHLAERMAEGMETERRTAYEMEIARQVQSRLFPQVLPRLGTLEYAGGCHQARAVGGDYYDFLDLGPGRLGLVLADVAGKGISAALLMATLQASLRSQYASALPDVSRLLLSVNRVFYPSAAPGRFATLFFGEYDDATRRLRYSNCGHNPPILLRADGRVERLQPTASVLGVFEEWECAVAEVALAAGDLLLVFSDGASEAWSDQGEEFGEVRLIETLASHRDLPVAELLEAIMDAVRQFSGSEQEDDLTLVVARAL